MIGKSVKLVACVFILFLLGLVGVEVEDDVLVESENRLDSVTEVKVAMANNVDSVEEQTVVSRDPDKLMVIIGLFEMGMTQI